MWLVAFVFFIGAVCTALFAKRRGELFKEEVSIPTIKLLSWLQFEDFVAELFRRRGYAVQKFGGARPDDGIDLKVWKGGEFSIVQCKHSRFQKIGVKVVREMLGIVVVEKATKGIVIATEGFTPEALKFASRTQQIQLISGTDLLKVLKKVNADEKSKTAPTAKIPVYEYLSARAFCSRDGTRRD